MTVADLQLDDQFQKHIEKFVKNPAYLIIKDALVNEKISEKTATESSVAESFAFYFGAGEERKNIFRKLEAIAAFVKQPAPTKTKPGQDPDLAT